LLEVELADQRRPVVALVAVTRRQRDPVAGLPLSASWRKAVRPTGRTGELLSVVDSEITWLIGVGDGTEFDWRAAGAALVRGVNERLAFDYEQGRRVPRSLQIQLPDDIDAASVSSLTFGLALGGYGYRISAEPAAPKLTSVRLVAADDTHAEVVRTTMVHAQATALGRDLANTPPNIKNPPWLADQAARIAGASTGLRVTVRDEKWLADKGFGGLLAVGGGSATPPRLIEMTWRPRGVTGRHLVLVGKGITFDTGGISIKPAANMHWMRTDMAGGGAVIAAMRAIAELRLPVKVTGLVPAAENHVSGGAYRPGDVVRHYDGTTTEVANTDAEGRMVLADALGYAVRHHKADVLVDMATLTGAIKMTLGVRTGGLFATDDELAAKWRAAGDRVGESFWRMPFVEEDEISLRGTRGDLKQAPGGPGAIAAAMFLREFTGGLPWLHLDIAGAARAEQPYAEIPVGATGFGARTLVEFAADFAATQ
jgi:leucyl aminopeptidase